MQKILIMGADKTVGNFLVERLGQMGLSAAQLVIILSDSIPATTALLWREYRLISATNSP